MRWIPIVALVVGTFRVVQIKLLTRAYLSLSVMDGLGMNASLELPGPFRLQADHGRAKTRLTILGQR